MAGRPTNEAQNYFALGKQSAQGTEASTFFFLKHLDGTGLDLEETIESEHEGGDAQEVGLRYKSALAMDGDAITNARPEVSARFFSWTLGADAVAAGTGTATALQIHTSTPTTSLPYLTAEQYYGDKIERVSNAQITGLTVEGEAGRPLKLTANLIGGGTPYSRSTASALTASRETGQPFFYPGGSYTIDGAGNTKITKFSAQVNRNVDSDIRTTTLFREDVVGLNFDTQLDFTLKYEDAGLYDKIHYGASGATVVPVPLSTGSFQAETEFGSGTQYRFVEINFPCFTYTGAKLNRLDPDGKTVYIDVTAMGIKNATHQVYCRTMTASLGAF